MPEKALISPLGSQFLDKALGRLVNSPAVFGLSSALRFPDELESLYRQDRRASRIRELKLTIALGCVLAMSTALTDFALIPDLGVWPIYLRAFSLMPLVALFFWMDRSADQFREKFLAFASIVCISMFLYLPFLSQSPNAPFAYATASLALIYANCLFPLRCVDAVPTNLIFAGLLICLTAQSSHIDGQLSFAISFQGVVAVIFSLIGNYRQERSARITHLLGSKDAIQQAALLADRDRFELLSNTDGLTGLANRVYFENTLQAITQEIDNNGKQDCIVMVDVDHFKSYNDTYGHPEGDRCLKLVASVLRAKVNGARDLVARYGGEEFIILLRAISSEQSLTVAERIRAAVEDIPVSDHGARRKITISMGLTSTSLRTAHDCQLAREKADQALYQSKSNGRNRFTQI